MAFGAGGGFNFSLPSTTTNSSVPTAGIAAQPKAATASPGFSFGPVAGGLSLGTTPVATQSGGLFNIGSGLTATSNTSSLFAAPPSTIASSGILNFVSAVTTTTTSTSGTALFTASTTGASNYPASATSVSSSFTLPNTSTATQSTGSFSFSSGTTAAPLSLNTSTTFSVGNTATAPKPLTGLVAPSATVAATLSTATTTSSSFGSSGVAVVPNLSMRQLEERLNKWLVEIKEQEERFIRQAAHVNSWDQILQNGHDQVQALKDTVHTVKSDQLRLEAELDFIRGQEDELERLLDPLESAVSATPASQMHQGDRQRDNMYHLAQNLDGQLRQMTDDLGKVIEHLNSNTSPAQPNDPVSLVGRILSAHMDTLKWIDHNTTLLSQKTEEVSKLSSDIISR